MIDDGVRSRLDELQATPLEDHPGILEHVHRQIESELEELRRGLPSPPDGT